MHGCDHSDVPQVPRHLAEMFHKPVCSLIRSVLCLQYEIRVLQARNVTEAWQQGYGSVCFLA